MLMSLMYIFFILLLFLVFGMLFYNLLNLKAGIIEQFSSSFIIGVGLSTFVIFLAGLLGVKFTIFNIIFTVVGVIGVLYLFSRFILKRNINVTFPISLSKNKKLTTFEKLLVIGMGYFIISSLLSNLYWPVWMWDAIQLYDHRAILIANNESIFFPADSSYEVLYPPMTSILHAIFYLIDFPNVKFIYTLIFVCLLFGAYSFMRKYSSRKVALFTSFLISFQPAIWDQSQYAITNLIHSTFLVFGSFYLIRRLVDKKISYVILYTYFFSISNFIRNEPLWIFLFAFLLLLIFFKKIRWYEAAIFAVVNYLFGMSCVYYRDNYQLLLVDGSPTQLSFISKLINYMYSIKLVYFKETTLQVYNSLFGGVRLLLLIIIYFSVNKNKNSFRHIRYLSITLLFYIIMFWLGSLYYRIISPDSTFLALNSSINRFGMFWNVLFVVLVLFYISEFIKLIVNKRWN